MDVKLHFLSNKINPFLLLYKLPFFKRKAEEKGENLLEIYNDTFTNKNYGFSPMFAGGITVGVVFILIVAFLKTAIFISSFDIKWNSVIIISLGIISYLICYFFIFKNDKYLEYFDIYANWSKATRRKNIGLSFLATIVSVLCFFLSLIYLNR